jgi:hypothetical protein
VRGSSGPGQADYLHALQSWTDLKKVRDALGLPTGDPTLDLTDARLQRLKDFFAARNEVAHELDLVDPSGKGSRTRRHRDMSSVGAQCDDALAVIDAFLRATAKQLRDTAPD